MEIINWKKYNTFQHRAGYNETCIDYIAAIILGINTSSI